MTQLRDLSLVEVLCAIGGIIGFIAAVVQIWEFCEKRRHLRRILVGAARGLLALAVVTIGVIATIAIIPRDRNPAVPPPADASPRGDSSARPIAGPDAKRPTRWVVLVPNNVSHSSFIMVSRAAARWERGLTADDQISMVRLAREGAETRRGVVSASGRNDLAGWIAGSELYPGRSIEEAYGAASDCLDSPRGDRRELVVVLSNDDDRGYVEVDRAKLQPAGRRPPRTAARS